jgi:hypothetical protein
MCTPDPSGESNIHVAGLRLRMQVEQHTVGSDEWCTLLRSCTTPLEAVVILID